MSLFGNFFKPAAPATPAPKPIAIQTQPIPAALPKISAPTAAEIAQQSNPSPAAQKILAANPQQTPSQYLNTLQDQRMGTEMVDTMAHGMPDREGVLWASKSAGQVSDKLPPEEVEAMKAADLWAKDPSPANQAAAGAAAAKTSLRGPGSLAAQGAAWAQPPPAPGAALPAGAAPGATATAPRLTPMAVSGAVLLAAATKAYPEKVVPTFKPPAMEAPKLEAPTLEAPKMEIPALEAPQAPVVVPPEVQAKTFQQQQPFINMGVDIASGKTGFA
jgi:hypothetical protein